MREIFRQNHLSREGGRFIETPIDIIQKKKLLGAIGTFPPSVSFRELPSASGHNRTRGNPRAEWGVNAGG